MPLSFESLVASGHDIRKEEDFDPMTIGTSAAILWRKQVFIPWARCVLRRASQGEFRIWNETGSEQLKTYTHCRDDDGELLNDSVEEEFQLTLAPVDWLKTTISAPAPVEAAPEVSTKPANVVDEGTAVSSTVSRAFRNVLSRVKTRKMAEGAAQAEEKKVLLPPPPEPPAPEQPPDCELPADSTTFAAETRYAVEGRALYVWSLTDQNVGVIFDDPAEPWVSFSRSEFEAKAKPVLEDGEDAVHSVIMQRLSAKGSSAAKVPAATLRDKHALSGAEAGEWEVFSSYVPGCSNFATATLAVKSKVEAAKVIGCAPPFISALKGEAPASITKLDGRVLGIVIGSEFKASSKKGQYRRWVLVRFQVKAAEDHSTSSDDSEAAVDCFVPLERVGLPSTPSPKSPAKPSLLPAIPSHSDCREAGAAAVAGRKPGTLQSAYMTAVKKLKVARAAHSAREATIDLNKIPLPMTRSAAKGAETADSDAKSKEDGEQFEKSTVPAGLAFWGEGKLDLVPLPKLLLALTENGLPQPPAKEKDKAGWAKQMLLKTFKHRNYSGWKEPLAEEQEAKKKPRTAKKTGKEKARRPRILDDDNDDEEDGPDGGNADGFDDDDNDHEKGDDDWSVHGAFVDDEPAQPSRSRRERACTKTDIARPTAPSAPAPHRSEAPVTPSLASEHDAVLLERRDAAAARYRDAAVAREVAEAAAAEIEQMKKQQLEFQAQMQQMMQAAFASMSAAVSGAGASQEQARPSAPAHGPVYGARTTAELSARAASSRLPSSPPAASPAAPGSSSSLTPPSAILRKRRMAAITAGDRAELAFMVERDELMRLKQKQKSWKK